MGDEKGKRKKTQNYFLEFLEKFNQIFLKNWKFLKNFWKCFHRELAENEKYTPVPVTAPNDETYSLTNLSVPVPGKNGRDPRTGRWGGPGGKFGGFLRQLKRYLNKSRNNIVRRISLNSSILIWLCWDYIVTTLNTNPVSSCTQ